MLDPTHEVAQVVNGWCCLKTKVLGLSGPDVMALPTQLCYSDTHTVYIEYSKMY